MGLLSEFKDFAMRGNVVDMAVGIVIGAAFGKIVSSFVNDVLMPPIGLLLGGVDFSNFRMTLKEAVPASEGVEAAAAVTMNYGVFFNVVLDFIIIAFAIFMVIKLMNAAKKKEEAAPTAPPKPSKEETLLTEIRDALVSGR
ncbi:MAG: large-conductance mechanosensitive channel protein MscL [Planctomycetota bacterium]|jgi:large conductance mechanosensitive channel